MRHSEKGEFPAQEIRNQLPGTIKINIHLNGIEAFAPKMISAQELDNPDIRRKNGYLGTRLLNILLRFVLGLSSSRFLNSGGPQGPG